MTSHICKDITKLYCVLAVLMHEHDYAVAVGQILLIMFFLNLVLFTRGIYSETLYNIVVI